jgi:putative DNA primase/helicase
MSRLERIVQACGGELIDGGRRALIPGPGHSNADRSVSLLEGDDGRVLIYCFSPKDNWRDVRRALEERGLLGSAVEDAAEWTSRPPRLQRAGERLARAKRFWIESHLIDGTIAERYLHQRALPSTISTSPALRFHPGMTSLEDRQRRPALMSAIMDGAGALQGVEVTLLSMHGAAKAALATPRRIIGRMIGGAIRLAAPTDTLIIAEGMESAASASVALGFPAWALLSAHNLALFSPPIGVERLLIASDGDAAGKSAAQRLAQRLKSQLVIERAAPPDGCNDWNDWLASCTSKV